MERSDGCLSLDTRFRLAKKTFAYTAEYDTAIAGYLESCTPHSVRSSYPEVLS
jgi:phosphoribosylaminoimidazolecarboxamide formyltransferase/IMP cyclohydrolase